MAQFLRKLFSFLNNEIILVEDYEKIYAELKSLRFKYDQKVEQCKKLEVLIDEMPEVTYDTYKKPFYTTKELFDILIQRTEA